MSSDSELELLSESSDEFSISESDSDEDCLDEARDWCKIETTAPKPSPPKFPFTGNSGIKVNLGDSEDPMDYFNLFFDSEIISFIVEETNRFAESFFESNELTPSSSALKWTDTDPSEIKCFISLLILQGIVQKPVEKWFWSKRPILHTPFFGKVMTVPRFQLIMKFLHLENSVDFNASNCPNPRLKKYLRFTINLLKSLNQFTYQTKVFQ